MMKVSKDNNNDVANKLLSKIENKSKKTIAYSKRKRGVLKKLIELSEMCSQDIFMVIWDKEKRKLVHYQSNIDFNINKVNEIVLNNSKNSNSECYQNSNYNLLENERILKDDIC